MFWFLFGFFVWFLFWFALVCFVSGSVWFDFKQQAASSKQQAASSKQQAASSKQQAASNKQQATEILKVLLSRRLRAIRDVL